MIFLCAYLLNNPRLKAGFSDYKSRKVKDDKDIFDEIHLRMLIIFSSELKSSTSRNNQNITGVMKSYIYSVIKVELEKLTKNDFEGILKKTDFFLIHHKKLLSSENVVLNFTDEHLKCY